MNGIRVDQRIRCDYRDSYADTEYRLCDKEQRRDESLHEPIHEHYRAGRTLRLHRVYVAPSQSEEIRICERV